MYIGDSYVTYTSRARARDSVRAGTVAQIYDIVFVSEIKFCMLALILTTVYSHMQQQI